MSRTTRWRDERTFRVGSPRRAPSPVNGLGAYSGYSIFASNPIMNKKLTSSGLCLFLLRGCKGAEPERKQLSEYREKQLQKARQVEDTLKDRVARLTKIPPRNPDPGGSAPPGR